MDLRSVSWKNHRQKPGKSIPKSLNRWRGIKIYTGEVEPSPSNIFFGKFGISFFFLRPKIFFWCPCWFSGMYITLIPQAFLKGLDFVVRNLGHLP